MKKLMIFIAMLLAMTSFVYAFDGVCCDSVGSNCKGSGVTGIAGGYEHSCFLLDNGNVTCQGSNSYGESDDYTGGDAIGVAAGSQHTCFLLDNGNVDCQGSASYSKSDDYTGGDAIGVAAGFSHTCFLLDNGNVTCQGSNTNGESNDYTGGNAIGVAAGDRYTCFLLDNGNVDCQGSNVFGESNDYTGGDAIGVAAEGYHTCFLLDNGNVDFQGFTGYSESDYTGGDAVGVAAGRQHTCFLLDNGNVTCQGTNTNGESNDYTGGDAVGVAGGYQYTCFLLDNGTVDCQGTNSYGESNDYTGGDAVCSILECGNGVLEYPEQCDDGGTTGSDGCSATCTSETADLWFDQVIITDGGDGSFTYAFMVGNVPRILIVDNSGLMDLTNFQYEEQGIGGSGKILVSMANLVLTDTTKIITLPDRNKYCAVDENNFLSGSILGNWQCWTESGRITWEPGVNPCGSPGSPMCGKNATGSDVCQYQCEEIVVDSTTYAQLSGFTYTNTEAGEDTSSPIPEFSNILGIVALVAVIAIAFMLLRKK
jgi:cysteine-rich repeat protein